MESRLYAILVADASIADQIGTRIYPANVPVDDTFPRVVYARTGHKAYHDLDGVAVYNITALRLDCQARTFAAAKALADAVEVRLNGYRSVPDGIDKIRVEDVAHNAEPTVDAGNSPIFVHSVEIVVSWR
jgi:hypothetical protein